ncbi:fructose-bisphosphate aldolase-like [Hylaeus anthracinus]|uniref:fructose-bisphosphate aldolase-like n=1 Tax=Hylaeus volcanicus TaxID=313075 RepID=UPI0023B7D22B|nr:fructose-bisphosphate aldolase-like [Hylaeus volcanicus]XP_054004094.1 fructose-bisphosphate aldolase-like [Hylaeus anthracinus]
MKRLGDRCSCKDKILSPVTKYAELDPALCSELQKIVETILAPGKGLLACDESPKSLEERFQKLGIENNEDTRRDYRQMLFTADQSQLSKYISGVILHHETVYQKTSNGIDFVQLLRERNVLPGVKVDGGLVDLFGSKDEKTTEGLDSLQERCIQYKRCGCHFAKWRCTYRISETTPSQLAMVTNANVLARYASICQSARMVPIIEPEILNDNNHGINAALEIHEEVLSILFRALNEHRVYLEGAILKPAMVLPGINKSPNCTPQIIAEYTLTAMQRTVPPAVPAILFLSGGQSDTESTINLNAICAYDGKKPWRISFCYGRALQNAAMNVWKGLPENVQNAQAVLLERARLCSEASLGKLQQNGVCTKKATNGQ